MLVSLALALCTFGSEGAHRVCLVKLAAVLPIARDFGILAAACVIVAMLLLDARKSLLSLSPSHNLFELPPNHT